MYNSSAAKLAEINLRLTTSSVGELVKWHKELRESLEQSREGEEAENDRALLMKIQDVLVSANSSKVDSDNKSYKELIKHIQDQENR